MKAAEAKRNTDCRKIRAANADYVQSTAAGLGLYVNNDWSRCESRIRNDGITYKWQRMIRPYT